MITLTAFLGISLAQTMTMVKLSLGKTLTVLLPWPQNCRPPAFHYVWTPPPPVLGSPTPPPKQQSALRSTSFAPVATNPIPTMNNNAVNMDPDFFEGVSKDGKGPGPHFITMSFIKDKTKIRDQLLKALASAVSILSANIPGVLVHCIQKDGKLPPLSSFTASNFPTSGMQARYYLFIQNAWSLQPGTRNKPKPTAPKIGKDG
jgi:hypothetical protein